MEVGSYRGHTALMLAKHLDADARIVTVDVDERHGDAFRDTPYATRIERRVTRVQSDAFLNDAPCSYDLIFLDADHAYAAVKRDTAILLDLLSERGHFVWHDYGNWGKFSGKNGVPEFLHALSGQRPVAQIAGTWLAVHSPAWSSGEGAIKFRNALIENDNVPHRDPWASEVTRG
jgi:hypothetical protein